MKFGIFVATHIRSYLFCNPVRISKRYKSNLQWVIRKKNPMDFPPARDNPIIMKLDTPEFHSIFTDELKYLVELFKKHNYEIRVAGGAVRDILMKITPKDLDFATTATPKQMKDLFTKENIRMINEKGESHGTITARINDKENFEVTTLRIDVVTDGRRAEVEFTTDWKLDANRRDLTINSMFLDFEGNVYDYFFGYDDLQKRRIVFVGHAVTRIQEDYLRILRYFRFYGRIADEPDKFDEPTIQAIKENVEGLVCVSGERIWTELSKILEGKFSREIMNKIIECGMAEHIGLPKNPDIENYNKVVMQAEKNNVKLLPGTALAALLRNTDEANALHSRLKFSVFNRELIWFIVDNRDTKVYTDGLRFYQYMLLHEVTSIKYKRDYIIQLLKYRGDMDTLKEFENWQLPRFPVNGNDIKPYVDHGKLIGIVMKRLKDVWLDHDFKSTKEELIGYIPEIVKRINENDVKKLSVKNK